MIPKTASHLNASDVRWYRDQDRFGWILPAPAPWPLRLPIIRFCRAVWAGVQVDRHLRRCRMMGLGAAPSGYDLWVVYAIARGCA